MIKNELLDISSSNPVDPSEVPYTVGKLHEIEVLLLKAAKL